MPNDDDLRDRMKRFEDKFESQSAGIQKVDRNLATVEAKIDGHSNEIKKLDATLEGLRTLVIQGTSEGRTVTWKQVGYFGAFVVVVVMPILGLLVTVSYKWVLPQRIETVVSNSKSLNSSFGALIDEKLKPTNATLADIKENTNGIRKDLNAVESAVKTTVTRKGVVHSLKHHTSGRQSALSGNLSEARDLLTAVEELKVPLERQDFKDLSIRLYSQYVATKEPQQKSEFLATFIAAANAKSVSEPTLHAVPSSVFTRANDARNYFEGTIDLSSQLEWNGAVFNKCTVVISKPEVGVILHDVRFLDCNFDRVTESAAIRDFLSTYLETTRPTVTFLGYKVLIDYSIGQKSAAKKAHR
jgi:archaellum component FlaC